MAARAWGVACCRGQAFGPGRGCCRLGAVVVSGVQAGAKGGFALVIGIAREGNELELRENGADIAVRDLSETNLEQINLLVQDKRTGAR